MSMNRSIRSLAILDESGRRDLPAGDFSAWLRRTRAARLGGDGASVPCGECTACCRSSLFVHVGPEETDTLARIPKGLLFPAPGRPEGHKVLGYDEEGRCPMLVDEGCSIYEHRPRACREYDCRVFPAAGVEASDEGKVLVDRQARRWSFSHPTEGDLNEHAAVRAAASFLRRHPELLEGQSARSPTRLALLALEVYDAFLERRAEPGASDEALVESVLEAARRFASQRTARSARSRR